jgi:ribonuclease D
VVAPWIRTSEELARFASALSQCRALALDSESDSLHHHVEKVCLVQLATDRGDAVLVDPLSVRDLAPLGPALADPEVVKVLHGADYDVTTMKRDFSVAFAGLFDTMIAARFLGLPEVGLQAVARAELGVTLSKDSQKDDWSRRPLTPAQEAYALADVQHLLALHGRLVQKLRDLGRLEWVLEESAAVAALEPARRRREGDAYLKVKGARRLSRRELAVLREVWAWREELATATDVPAFKLLGNDVLMTLAEEPPRTAADLGRVRGISPRLRDQSRGLLEAVSRGLAVPASELPSIADTPRPVMPQAVRRRIEALRAWRVQEAARAGLDVSVVLPQRLLERVAEAGPRTLADLQEVEGLRRWRMRAFGEALLAATRTV